MNWVDARQDVRQRVEQCCIHASEDRGVGQTCSDDWRMETLFCVARDDKLYEADMQRATSNECGVVDGALLPDESLPSEVVLY